MEERWRPDLSVSRTRESVGKNSCERRQKGDRRADGTRTESTRKERIALAVSFGQRPFQQHGKRRKES